MGIIRRLIIAGCLASAVYWFLATANAGPIGSSVYAKSEPAQNSDVEEQEIRSTLHTFYDGWNSHDIDKIVSIYADDIDHINVFGVWHKGKAEIRDDVAKLHAAGQGGHKDYTIEKIRMLKPDVAVVQVKAISKFCNIGTYVMSKQTGKWLVVSFTNVQCNQPDAPKY